MIFIIPVGHESNLVRRIPWITWSIMAICLLTYVFVNRQMNDSQIKLQLLLKGLFGYYEAHPYLELDERLIDRLQLQAAASDLRKKAQQSGMLPQPPPWEELEFQQNYLDEISRQVLAIFAGMPLFRWGYIPAHPAFMNLFSYQFLHGGTLHLIFNLLFLFLCSPFIEDAWGRLIYPFFYLSSGVAAALLYAFMYPTFSGPLIGASGAIAGVMGAFLIRFWRTKIDFHYIIFFITSGKFSAPALLMLPLWLINEFYGAGVGDSVARGGGGIAQWAHIGGFLFGLAVALVLKYFHIEEKYVNPKILREMTYIHPMMAALDEANREISAGENNRAFTILAAAASRDPSFEETTQLLWTLGLELGRMGEPVSIMTRLALETKIRSRQFAGAYAIYLQLREQGCTPALSLQSTIILANYLLDRSESREGELLACALLQEMEVNRPPQGVLRDVAELAFILRRQGCSATAVQLLNFVVHHPEIPAATIEEFKQRWRQSGRT